MHDPQTVAHEIKSPFKKKGNFSYRPSIITIWHVDPEKDGTDDSCGWFIRNRHVKKKIIDDVVKEFQSEWDTAFTGENGFVYNCGWFNPEGENILSVRAIILNMYIYAAKIALNPTGKTNPSKMWDKAWEFVRKYYVEIMYFAENNRDSLRDTVVRKFQIGCNVEYTKDNRLEMIYECASIITCDIMRKTRKWYHHPRWHILHWRIQFHPLQNIKRRFFDKCYVCGKRGFKSAPMSEWDGTKLWHQECDNTTKKVQQA